MTGSKNVNHFKFQSLTIIYYKEFYHKKFKLEIGNNMVYLLILYQLIMVFSFSTAEDGL